MTPKSNIVIGDIHGYADALAGLLEYHGRDHRYIFLGDYIDRGPDSRRVVDLILDLPDVIALQGNHEELLLTILGAPTARRKRPFLSKLTHEISVAEKRRAWLTRRNGGQATLESFGLDSGARWEDLPARYREFFENLLAWHEDEMGIYVHAGIDPAKKMADQENAVLFWSRRPWLESLDRYRGKPVYFGHTITSTQPRLCNDQGLIYRNGCVGLDTSAYMTGILTSVVLTPDKEPRVVQYARAHDKIMDLGPLHRR